MSNNDNFLGEAVSYVNHLNPVHSITYGVNYGVPFLDNKIALNVELLRSNFISSDIPNSLDAQTMAGLSFSYFPTDTFEFNIGVRKVFELKDISQTGVTFGTLYYF